MNINEEIKRLESELPNTCCQVYEYSEDYISDRIHDIADGNVDIYTKDLIDWLHESSDAIEYVEEAVSEFGIDSKNFDLIKLFQSGQYLMYERELYDNIQDTCYLYALHYIKEEQSLEELPDDILEKIEDIDYNCFERFSEIDEEIKNILTEHNIEVNK